MALRARSRRVGGEARRRVEEVVVVAFVCEDEEEDVAAGASSLHPLLRSVLRCDVVLTCVRYPLASSSHPSSCAWF